MAVTRKAIKSETDELDDVLHNIATNINKSIKDDDLQVVLGDDDGSAGKSVPFWVRTYIPALDYAIGGRKHPGIPFARIVEIFGGEGCGKSTLAVWITKCAIEQYKTFALYQDAERVLTPEIIKGTGLNMKRIIMQNPETLEEVFQTQEATLDSLEQQSGDKRPVVTVVDSVAACSTQAELNGEYGDAVMASHARILSQALRKIKGRILSNCVLAIFVNQIRDNMNQSFGKKTTTPGGRALPFYSSVRVEMAKIKTLKKDSSSDPYGSIHQATIIKNKVAPPLRKAEFEINYIEDEDGSYPQINIPRALIDWCLDKGLLEGKAGRVMLDGKNVFVTQAVEMVKADDQLLEMLIDLAYSYGTDDEDEDEVEDEEE
jgi:recombination protein RecA